MSDLSVSPLDRARMPDNFLDRLTTVETILKQLQLRDVQAQTLSELSNDAWDLNISWPYICQGYLSAVSTVIAFNSYKGNLCSVYNGSDSWYPLIIRGYQAFVSTFNTISAQQNIDNITTVAGDPNIVCSGSGLSAIQPFDARTLIPGMIITSGAFVGKYVLSVTSRNTVQLSNTPFGTVFTPVSSGTNSSGTAFWIPADTDVDFFAVDDGSGNLELRGRCWNPRSGGSISGATNATPIVITSTAHGLATGDLVDIWGISGNSAANGVFRITVLTANTFSLQTKAGANVAGSGAYVSGGTWRKINQTVTRQTTLTTQDGIYVLSTDKTYRYLGTGHSGPSNGSSDAASIANSATQLFLWNYYNRLRQIISVSDGSASWTIATASGWEADHNDFTNRLEFVIGISEDNVNCNKYVTAQTGAVLAASILSGISLDAVAAPNFFNTVRTPAAAATRAPINNAYYGLPGEGYHYFQPMEEALTANGAALSGGEHLVLAEIWG